MSHRSPLPAVVLLLTLALLAPTSFGADWPQWRGAARDGHVPGADLPGELPATLTKVFEVEVGTGHSSPVVIGDVIYLHTRQGDDEVVQALALRSGETLSSATASTSCAPTALRLPLSSSRRCETKISRFAGWRRSSWHGSSSSRFADGDG